MKNAAIGLALLVLVLKWDAITGYFGPPEFTGSFGDEAVVLYATSWCGYCTKTREFLEGEGIPFTEYDIEKSEEGRRQYQELGGTGAVPLVLVNGTVIKGYSPSRIKELL